MSTNQGQGKNPQASNDGGQQGAKHTPLTPSGGTSQQNQSAGGTNQHGSNIKDKHHDQQAQSGAQGQQDASDATRQPSQQGGDHPNRGSEKK